MPQKRRDEAIFCTKLQKWLIANMSYTCFIEAKVSVGDKPFNLKSGFKSHQLPTLQRIREGSFAYKISDMDRTQKPFDIMFVNKEISYVALMWVRKGNKTFYLITPDKIERAIRAGLKSLTEAYVDEIYTVKGELK